jgi:tetratricopeptide (TPR) repeat protein
MIDILEEEGKWQKAVTVADVAITQHPLSADLYLRKAELLLNRNMIEECIVTIDRAELIAPTNFNLRILRAELFSSKGLFEEALSILDALKGKTTLQELSEIFLAEAHIYEDLRDFPSMFRSLRRCLLTDRANTEGYTSMLLLVEKKRYYKESWIFHNKLIDQDAYNWRAWLNLGFALRGCGKNEEAIEAFEYTFAIQKKCKMAYMEAADLLIEKGNYNHALYIYENAVFNTQGDGELMLQMGYCYEMLKDYKKANAYYQRALEFTPDDANVFYRIGECAKAMGQYKEAIDSFREAIKYDSNREDCYASLADSYFQIDQLSNALFSYRKAAYLAPDDVSYWLRYTYFLLNIGQEKMALRALEKADINCGAPEIEYCRIACLYQMGKQSEALYRLGEALNCDYDTHKSLFQWRPELAKNKEMQAVIMAFLP